MKKSGQERAAAGGGRRRNQQQESLNPNAPTAEQLLDDEAFKALVETVTPASITPECVNTLERILEPACLN